LWAEMNRLWEEMLAGAVQKGNIQGGPSAKRTSALVDRARTEIDKAARSHPDGLNGKARDQRGRERRDHRNHGFVFNLHLETNHWLRNAWKHGRDGGF